MSGGGNNQAATSLADFINTERERKKNAQKAFGNGPSLASRIGVQKQSSASTVFQKQRGKPADVGNIDAEGTHGLHHQNKPPASRSSRRPPHWKSPHWKSPHHHRNSRDGRGQARNQKRSWTTAASRALAVSNPRATENSAANIVKPKSKEGMPPLRRLAGPYAVMAVNLPPGTSAAGVRRAMGPVGGGILTCKIVAYRPRTAEIVFETKEGADEVIRTFDGQTYDGRHLDVLYSNFFYLGPW